MNCKDCKYYKKTNQYRGYCILWKDYVEADDSCEEVEEE